MNPSGTKNAPAVTMLPGNANEAAMKSRQRCTAETFRALWYSDGSMLFPKMSFITDQPKYVNCTI